MELSQNEVNQIASLVSAQVVEQLKKAYPNGVVLPNSDNVTSNGHAQPPKAQSHTISAK